MLKYSKEVNKALRFMIKAHEGQVDKQGLPYLIHPLSVASDMENETLTVIALLHDVLEDTDYTEEDLLNEGFSVEVVDALKLLKHEHGVPYLEYVENLKHNDMARRVKIADLKHNLILERFDGEIPQHVLDKMRDCYFPALRILGELKN
ncbi:MAG: GTP pyrophosphokinase [Clostridia bacterium]|nr:GTP pyrophosphokinase [Clostridia bacterium]